MNRRELLKMIAVTTGTAMIGGNALSAMAVEAPAGPGPISDDDVRLLDEIAETLLPRTDTPGAKDAEVGVFMQTFVRDCYTAEQQAAFSAGLVQFRERSEAVYGKAFEALETGQREALVAALNKEALAVATASESELAAHYFTMIKQLTLFGFFTSRVGANEVLRYVAVPGRYDGCAPYEQGQPAWATT
ncbi:gluconate 2-dehydrogenase subunit 3 family protein [Halomonas sp. V046]|uniref:gluconate 2-dehydrogenase subunit 3 family protein n=1 Tax=Halomonas sp. V046 TaxID=3459611 RepID=UPI004045074B